MDFAKQNWSTSLIAGVVLSIVASLVYKSYILKQIAFLECIDPVTRQVAPCSQGHIYFGWPISIFTQGNLAINFLVFLSNVLFWSLFSLAVLKILQKLTTDPYN